MIEKIWFRQSLAYWLAWPLLKPLSLLFGLLSAKRRNQFESGTKPSYRPPVVVVVVGNITVGGNGKTPVVIWLVELLKQSGFRPAVVSRGYGAKTKNFPRLVTDSCQATDVGDEPALIKQRTGVPVAIDPNRSNAVKAVLSENPDANVIVTDDGLQHYALQRDVELVVVDGKRRFGNQHLMPLGPLREPVTRLEEVDFVINNGGPCHGNEWQMTLKPDMAVNLVSGEKRKVQDFSSVHAMAGIGYPQRFFDTLTSLSVELISTHAFADHKDYDSNAIAQLAAKDATLFMTEKDAVKCKAFAQDNWWYLPVTADVDTLLEDKLVTKIREENQKYGSQTT